MINRDIFGTIAPSFSVCKMFIPLYKLFANLTFRYKLATIKVAKNKMLSCKQINKKNNF